VPVMPKLEAVCRAGRRGGRSRCAVRMTARGSVTPGMACGSRPVEATPQLGAFPTAGIRQGPGIAKGEAFSPLARPRQAAGWQIAPADSGRNRTKQYQTSIKACYQPGGAHIRTYGLNEINIYNIRARQNE
jgi:hypothetical protein